MKTPLLLKILTIAIFVVLIAVFVSYRAGILSTAFSDNETTVLPAPLSTENEGSDTVPVNAADSFYFDSLKASSVYSSKSMRIIPPKTVLRRRKLFDSSSNKLKAPGLIDTNKRKELMPGSKSAMISWEDALKQKATRDSILRQQKKQ